MRRRFVDLIPPGVGINLKIYSTRHWPWRTDCHSFYVGPIQRLQHDPNPSNTDDRACQRLALRPPHSTNPHVVRPLLHGRLDMIDIITADPNDRILREHLTRLSYGHVILTKVNTMGIYRKRDVNAVIDEQRDVVNVAYDL